MTAFTTVTYSQTKSEPPEPPFYQKLADKLTMAGAPYNASDNISAFLDDQKRSLLIDELTEKFEGVLDALVIDPDDPNSAETPRRLAKMYINEIMRGRYYPAPDVKSFPNDDKDNRYTGILTVRAEILSVCSHHHQPVKGVCYIGLIPSTKVIGLSKYARIAKHLAARGTLQEQLTNDIAKAIMHHTESPDVGVHIAAEHGCMLHRGLEAHSSLTQTTVLHGQFFKHDIKDEFLRYVQMQQMHKH